MRAKTAKRLKITVLSLILAAMGACGAGFGVTAYFMGLNFGRGDYPDPRFTASYRYDHYAADHPAEEVSFTSGDNVLKGRIYGLDNDKGLIVFAHGIGVGHETYINLLMRLVDDGWTVFAYDATGSGDSPGKGTRGLGQSVIDLDNALSFAEQDSRLQGRDTYLLGHSWGGYAVAAVLNCDHDIKACVSLSGYDTPYAELKEGADRSVGGISPVTYPFVWVWNWLTFGDMGQLSASEGIRSSGVPTLVLHGTRDDVISYEGASIISKQGKLDTGENRFITLDTDHNDYFSSEEWLAVKGEWTQRGSDLSKQYNGRIPDDVREEYYASIDKELYNSVNEDLVAYIEDFYEARRG